MHVEGISMAVIVAWTAFHVHSSGCHAWVLAADILTDPSVPGTGLAALEPLTRMQGLTLWNCLGISEEGLAAVTHMRGLTSLCLRGCQQLGDELIWPLATLPALLRLDLRACERFTGRAVSWRWDPLFCRPAAHIFLGTCVGRYLSLVPCHA